jgi:hypothetical protein
MKIYKLILLLLFTGLFYNVCFSMRLDRHEFKKGGREIDFEMERKQSETVLYFQSLLFERSGSENGNYSICKTIEVGQVKINNGFYKTSDNYPLSAHQDCYYRMKIIYKGGYIKTFPPVLLIALIR